MGKKRRTQVGLIIKRKLRKGHRDSGSEIRMSEVSSEEEKYDKSSFETLRFSTKIFPIE